MDRLTYKSSFGDYGMNVDFGDDNVEKAKLRNALGKYEDLGYTPDELREILKQKESDSN